MAEKEGLFRTSLCSTFQARFAHALSLPAIGRTLFSGSNPSPASLPIKKPCKRHIYKALSNGGEGGIRTLDTLLTYTPLAGERLQPLGHFSGVFYCLTNCSVIYFAC